jgi:adenine-specific DNA-methyltransferase
VSDNQINLELLKELLGQAHTAPLEHYELSWAGKAAARREIQKTTSHTLKPAASNPAHAPHMLIEGENLEVLRVLQKSYYGRVKMIYIDPPYNTGNDSFVYPDNYSETLDEYQKRTGEKNAEGYLNKQSLWKKNSKESGQYHSAWLSMMYPRLYLARNLLRDDGVIFISIDDNEAANLKLLCDEVFGAENFVGLLVRQTIEGGKQDSKNIQSIHEYVAVYARNINTVPINKKKQTDFEHYNLTDEYESERGKYYLKPLENGGLGYVKSLDYPITGPDGVQIYPGDFNGDNGYRWVWGKERVELAKSLNLLVFINGRDGKFKVYYKIYQLMDSEGNFIERANPYTSMYLDGFTNRQSIRDIKSIFDKRIFDYSKPISFMKQVIQMGAQETSIILDFFAGSGTTAQAVMELNLEDGGNRQCICVQMPEILDESSEAYKAGYRTIADINRARIDKVISKLKTEQPDKTTDLACAQFTLAPSNFKVWQTEVADAAVLAAQLEIFQTAEHTPDAHVRENDPPIADHHTAMLTELLLKKGLGALGVAGHGAISKAMQVAGVTVYRVLTRTDETIWLCFEAYNEALKEAVVKDKPAQVLMLNSCFVGAKADELLSNLQLELNGLEIELTVI